jgi:hypothetical protein
VDGQRWYDEGPYGDDSNRYGALDGGRYAQPEEFSPYADQPPAYNEQASNAPMRRSRGPQQRRGKRSGLVIPDVPGYDDAGTTYEGAVFDAPDQGGYDAPDLDDDPVRLTALDRQELRERSRERGVPSGPPAPPPPAGHGTVFHAPTTAIQAPAIQAPAIQAQAAQVAPAATYRSRRPGVAALLAFGGVVAELILIKVLLANLFDSTSAAISGTIGALFAIAGVPMVIIGLYGLATGAATASGPQTGRAWLRTPLAYLPVGLILIIAAGLAA